MLTYFWRLYGWVLQGMEDTHYCLQRHYDVRLFHRVVWEIEREEKLQTKIHAFCFPPGHSSVPSVEP